MIISKIFIIIRVVMNLLIYIVMSYFHLFSVLMSLGNPRRYLYTIIISHLIMKV